MANRRRVAKGISITIWMEESELKRLDTMVDRVDMSRSRLVRQMIRMGEKTFREMTNPDDPLELLVLVRKIEAGTF